MALIAGTLNNASGVRPNTKIILTAYKTTSDVVTLAPDTTIVTSATGTYSFECKPSFYNVRIQQPGYPCENVGIIQVYSDSVDGTINDFLTTFKPDDLTPEILKQCIAAQKAAEASAKIAQEESGKVVNATKLGLQVNNLHTTRDAITWKAGLYVEDPAQLYVHDGIEYLPSPKANQFPFTTGATFNSNNWVLSELVTKNMLSYNSATISQLFDKFGVIVAWAQAANYKTLIIDKDSEKSGSYIIPSNQLIRFDNAKIVQTDDLNCLTADNSNWAIEGSGSIERKAGRPNALINGSVGLKINKTAFNFSITGDIGIRYFAQAGYLVNGGGIVSGKVSNSKVSGLSCIDNAYGCYFIAGFPAEYITHSNCTAINNTLNGVYDESGNINWSGGTITGNGGGILLKAPLNGANPHHGMFVGTNINHNRDYQLKAHGVYYGYDFSGCHFYDNGKFGKDGIHLLNSRGVNITGGEIGCGIYEENDTSDVFNAHYGYNNVSNNLITGNGAIITGGNYTRTKLLVSGNFNGEGSSEWNDHAPAYAVSRQNSDKVFPAASTNNVTTLDDEIIDNRDCYGASYVVPFKVTYTWSVNLQIKTASSGDTLYVIIMRDDAGSGSWSELARIPVTYYGSGLSIAAGEFTFIASKGAQLGVFLQNKSNTVSTTILPNSQISFVGR